MRTMNMHNLVLLQSWKQFEKMIITMSFVGAQILTKQQGRTAHTQPVKEYAQVEEVLAGFGVDLVSASDLSRGIGVSEMAEY